MKPLLPLWAALLVAAAAGPILDMAYPSVGAWPARLRRASSMSLLTLIGRSAWGSLAVGLVFGAFFYFVHIAWITRYLGVVPWFALGGLETLFMGLGAIPITLAYRWMPRALPARWAQLTLLPAPGRRACGPCGSSSWARGPTPASRGRGSA